MNISRRDFIKVCGASAAMLGVGAQFAPNPFAGNRGASAGGAAVPVGPQESNGVLIDTTQCVGCRSCQRACALANGLPEDPNATCLSASVLSIVDMKNISPNAAKPVIKPVKLQCMHCDDPACVSVCPVGAIYKKSDGTVAYDAYKCIGCRYCMTACPFGIPKYDWNAPDPKINKCARGCMANGQRDTPACVQACPNRALTYGRRNDLLLIARERINANPTKYVDHIYGEHEVGGTSMLYLSATPFEQLGFRTDLPTTPLPHYTMNVMEKVPWVLGAVFAAMSGIAWWTHRGEDKELVEAPVPVTNE